ncbi:Beta/Gamma Crystallin Domain-Containing Protein 1, partial [Manis pentadactyla]
PRGRGAYSQALLAGTAAPSGPHGRERRISAFQGVPRRLLSLLCRRAPNRAEPRPAGGPARAPPSALDESRRGRPAEPHARGARASQGAREEAPGRARRPRPRPLPRTRARVAGDLAPRPLGVLQPRAFPRPRRAGLGARGPLPPPEEHVGRLAEPHSPAGGAPTPQALLAGTAAPSGPHGRERRISAFQGVPRRLLSLLCRRRLTALSPAPPEVPPGPRPSALDEKPPRPPRRAARAGSPGVAGCARGCSGRARRPRPRPLPRMRARVAAELRRCPGQARLRERARPAGSAVETGDAGRAARPGARPRKRLKP